MDERRRFPRYERAFETRYSYQKNASSLNYTISKNISKHGICIPAVASLKNGDRVKLDIAVTYGRPAVSTAGRVVWTKFISRAAPLPLEAGIEFSAAAGKDIERLIDTA